MSIPFTTFLPLIGMFCVLTLGILVYFKDRKSKLNIIFGLITVSLSVILFGTFEMFLSQTENDAILWDRFIYIGAVFLPILMYHFSIVFSQKKENKKLLLFNYILSALFLIASRTDYFVSGLFMYPWGVHTQARILHHIFLIFFFALVILTLKNLFNYYRLKTLSKIERMQARFILIAFFVLLSIGPLGYLPAYNIGIYPFAYFSFIFFVLILAYAILKHHLLNIGVIATEFFVGLVGFIFLIEVILSKSFSEIVFRLAILLSFGFLGYLLIKSVMNEIKRREEMEVLTEKLEELDRAKSEFVSIASHQLRTPLTAIKGYVSMILDKTYGEMPEEMERPLKNISISNERLIKLVNDLLNISRIEAGRMEIKMENLSIENIIASVVEELKNIVKEKGLYLKFEKPETALPKILIDADKIRQVILNLIDNAIKYTDHGGITVKLEIENLKLKIAIQDTGEGMTKEEILKMFESFSRGSAGTRLHTEGTGLGLYIAKKFIEMHKGRIWVESKGKGKGSKFYIELPIS